MKYVFAIVIGVGVILLALPALLPICGGGRQKMARTFSVCTAFEIAVNNFESAYDFLPYGASLKGAKTDQSFRSDSDLMAVLTGQEAEINFKQIKFFYEYHLKGTDKSNFRDGMHIDGEDVSLYDSWGNLYYITIDYDGDQRIQHPFEKGKVIEGKRVIMYSAGPDGEMGSDAQNKDNPSNF